MTHPTQAIPGPRHISLWRRLAAIFYDSLVLVCLIFVAWLPVPLVPDHLWPDWIAQGWRLAYLFLLIYSFFGWFWCHGGQTLGMKAWRIRLEDATPTPNGFTPIGWKQAFLRLTAALVSWTAAGLGFLWSLVDRDQRTWHDMVSHSRLVHVSRDHSPKSG